MRKGSLNEAFAHLCGTGGFTFDMQYSSVAKSSKLLLQLLLIHSFNRVLCVLIFLT